MLEEFNADPFFFFFSINRTFRCLFSYWRQAFDLLDVTTNQHLSVGPSIFIRALTEHGFERKSSEQILLQGVCYSVTGEI